MSLKYNNTTNTRPLSIGLYMLPPGLITANPPPPPPLDWPTCGTEVVQQIVLT